MDGPTDSCPPVNGFSLSCLEICAIVCDNVTTVTIVLLLVLRDILITVMTVPIFLLAIARETDR